MGLLVGSMIVRFDSDKSCVYVCVMGEWGEEGRGEKERSVGVSGVWCWWIV